MASQDFFEESSFENSTEFDDSPPVKRRKTGVEYKKVNSFSDKESAVQFVRDEKLVKMD